MRLTPTLTLLAALLLTGSAVPATESRPLPEKPEPSADITKEAFLYNDAWLSDDARQGRETGTEGCRAAAQWIADRLDELKLPVPEGMKDRFQPWNLPGGTFDAEHSTFKVSGGGETTVFEHGKDYVDMVSRRSLKVTGPVVFAGYGITAPENGYDDFAGVDVKDKVVLVLRHEPREKDKEAKRWRGDRNTGHSWFVRKAAAAHKAGAAAILIATDPLHHETESISTTGVGRGRYPDFPVVMVSWNVTDRLLASAGVTLKELQKAIDDADAPASRPLDGASVAIDLVVDPIPTENIVALLPGSDTELKDEYVIIGAHYDHVGLGVGGGLNRSLWGQIHNGADDNASGSSALLEIAEHFAMTRTKPRRSLLFLWFAGEEKGLLGSRHYVQNPLVPNEKVVAMINMDMVGRYRPGSMDVVGATSGSTFKEIVEKASEGLDLEFQHTNSGMANSDGLHFHQAGIPTMFFFTGLHDDYHQPNDDWWSLNADGAARVATLAARTARALADADGKPAYTKISRQEMSMRPRNRVLLGVQIDPGSTGGARLVTVSGGSPAAVGGLKPNDVVLTYGGKSITSMVDLQQAIQRSKAGDTVKIEVKRGDEAVTVSVTYPGRAPSKPLLGVVWQKSDDPVKSAPDRPGVVIGEVTPGGSAAKADLKAGDRILSVGGKDMADSAAIDTIVRSAKPGSALSFKVIRGTKTLTIEITVPK